jgi:hypothetical protein
MNAQESLAQCDAARVAAAENENRIENRCTPPVFD